MTDQLRDSLQTTLGSAYVLERELGGGGMSRVFVATETALDRHVVIKVLPPDLAAEVNVERFRREITLAARLQHPHIVPLLTAGQTGALPYFTMPFVDGESLRRTLERTGELPIPTAVRYLREVASALAYAHANGVVHRDIKPDNVLISGGAAMVTDFGVAKALSAAVAAGRTGQLTGMGVALGTPAYMAPEQAAADPASDARADVYAFGAMAYELLTGQPPFSGRPAQALLAAHAIETPESVERRRPATPPALAALVMSCLEKRPADRPQTAADIVQALDTMPLTPAATGATAAYTAPSGSRDTLPSDAQVASGGHRGDSPPHHRPVSGSPWRRFALPAAGVAAVVIAALAFARLRSTPNAASLHPGETMLVVLPFDNEGPAADQYFADGLTEAISNRLASLHGLGVIDRRSANQYKGTQKTLRQIGRELGVQYVLEGTVRWAGDDKGGRKVQISPTLVSTADETTKLAAGPYVVVPADVFQVQTDVATKVAQALDVALGSADQKSLADRPTSNPEAYDAYLRAKELDKQIHTLSPTQLQAAIDGYERAVRLDPKFALAYGELGSDLLAWALLDVHDKQRLAHATAVIDSALSIDPALPEAHEARAFYLRGFMHRDADAYDELVRAQAGRPNDARLLSEFARAQIEHGRKDEGLANLLRAVKLDPRSTDVLDVAARTAFQYRRYAEADSYADRLIALAPDQRTGYHIKMQIATEGRGDTAAARRVFEEAERRAPHPSVQTVLTEVGLLGSGAWPRLDTVTLAAVHPEQYFDSVNFYIAKMDLFWREQRFAAARAHADTALRMLDRLALTGPFDNQVHMFGALGNAIAGHRDAARQQLALVKRDESAVQNANGEEAATYASVLAWTYAVLGDTNDTMAELQRVLVLPSGISPAYLRWDPDFAGFHSNPEFQRLVGGGNTQR